MWFQPFGVVTQCAAFTEIVVHSMTFYVCLVIDVQPVFVAKFVETSVLRIVAKTYAVQVMLFHQLEVTTHQILWHVMSCSRVVFMDIHSFQFQRLTVDE